MSDPAGVPLLLNLRMKGPDGASQAVAHARASVLRIDAGVVLRVLGPHGEVDVVMNLQAAEELGLRISVAAVR